MSYQNSAAGGVNEFQINTATGAVLVDIGSGTITAPATITLQGTVATKPATSTKGMAVLTPTGTSQTVTALGLSIVSTVAKILIWASAAGVTVNYNGPATSGSIPVPTTPTALDISAADLALLQLLGDATITVNIVQEG
jgi:hypothetical protein